MKFLIYEISVAFGTFWGWRFVDSNSIGGIGQSPFDTEEEARTNLTETITAFGGDPDTIVIEVEGQESA